MMSKIRISWQQVFVSIMLFLAIPISAQEFDYDFSDDKTGVTIYYNVTSDEYPLTVAVANRDFNYNSYTGSVTVPAKVFKGGGLYEVTSVWENAFAYSESLTEVVFPESVTSLEDGAFFGCKKLAKVVIPGDLKSIGNAAFYDCSSIETLDLPASLSQIGDDAFKGCTSLKSIYLHAEVPPRITGSSIGKIKGVVYVPKGCVDAYMASDIWSRYKIAEMEQQ